MAKFHSLKISEIRKETEDCVSVAFSVPESLQEEFRFIQGQYLTLKLMVDGEEIRRSYSICSGVDEGELRVAVKQVKMGKGSGFITQDLSVGEAIEVMTPMGTFHSPMKKDHQKHYVLFAGGSGITPMFSIIKTVLSAEPGSRVTLFYGNLNEDATIFKSAMDDLERKEKNRFKVYYILEKPMSAMDEKFIGMLTKDKVKLMLNSFAKAAPENEYFICGPTVMMDNVREVLEEQNTNTSNIHVEYFTAAKPKDNVAKVHIEKIKSQVSIFQYGMETNFELDSDGKSILDAAVDAGVDAPFACKGAVCATCRGKIIEGKVYMEKNFALTPEDIADGYILTCQSHPITPIVKIDYDA